MNTYQLDLFFRNLVNLNNFLEDPVKITYTNSKGAVQLETNSSDTEANALKPDIYTIQVGNWSFESDLALGGVYAILAVAINETSFVRS